MKHRREFRHFSETAKREGLYSYLHHLHLWVVFRDLEREKSWERRENCEREKKMRCSVLRGER